MPDVALLDVGGIESLVYTIDFITPIVPDPVDFGCIAAANALSDVYVSGSVPIGALAISCVPEDVGSLFVEALSAARSFLLDHGCPLLGGHSIRDDVPKLGFAVVGRPNATGRMMDAGAIPGDALILTKPLGFGIITSGVKASRAPMSALEAVSKLMIETSDFLPGLIESPLGSALHAATDVTGYGLLGHLMELCRRSGVGAEISISKVPVLPLANELAREGVCTSAAASNAEYVEHECSPALTSLDSADLLALTDPQTSGGALLAVAPDAAERLREALPGAQTRNRVIGEVTKRTGIRISA
jgi:selenide,water dikinase